MASGTGSIYHRQSDGRWVAAVTVGGRRIVRYAQTKREAQKQFRDLAQRQDTGTLSAPTKLTLRAWAERWLGSGEAEHRPATIATYRYALAPVLAAAGDLRLDRLTPEVLANLVDVLRTKGGKRRASQSFRVLHTCLAQAVARGLLATNPAERIAAPGYAPQEREHWTLPETQRFIATALTERGQHVPMLLFLLGTGLRRGECTALTWEDIDRAAGTVRVAKAIAFVRNRPVLQATKTRAGTRTVSLTDLALTALDLLPVRGEPTARIFTSGCGTPPTPSNVRTALHRLCDRAGVPRIPPHGLRHAHVSLLIAAGVDVLTISRRVGHTRTSLTLDIYGHVLRPDTEAAAGFNRLLAPTDSA